MTPLGRRDFLHPRQLLRAVDALQQQAEASMRSLERLAAEPIVTLQRPAMACLFEIQFSAHAPDRRQINEAFDWIDDLESQLTVYRDDSEVSRLNRRAAIEPVVVEERLFELLERCAAWTLETEGAFDITAGPLIRAWGFYRRQGRVPTPEELKSALACVGMHHVHLDPQARRVAFDQPGVEINFGAIGKGYALDRVAERLKRVSATPVLLSAGHSSMLAVGKPSWDDAWQVDLSDPRVAGRPLAAVRLCDRGLSTSGVGEHAFLHEGRRYGHILDPRNGWPARGVLQASVVAQEAAAAEALSTAFFLQGADWADAYCRRHPDVGAIMVLETEGAHPPRVLQMGAIDVRPYRDAS